MVNRIAGETQTSLRSALRLRGPFSRWPRTADAVLALVVLPLGVFLFAEEPSQDLLIRSFNDISLVHLIVSVAASGALYWRRSRPGLVLGVTLVAAVIAKPLGLPDFVGVAMPFALYSVGRYVNNDRSSYLGLGGALAVVVADLANGATAGEIGFGLFFVSVVWYIGRRIRVRGERFAHLGREQAAEAGRAVATERTRIARELHDVVAHRVSLMTVQAGAAKTVAADDPKAALRAMEAVEEAGREALGELRHLLGVLRPEAELDGLGPQPGVVDVPRLVDQFVEAGLEVSLTMEGESNDLPARVDLSAYRIVQEALTNVLKHAGPAAHAKVRLSKEDQAVVIEVFDDGQGDTVLLGSGHGIVGMRERALLLGGSLDAGPDPSGGFRVAAKLPIEGEQT